MNHHQVVARATGRADCDVISVDSGYSTPPALEGRSCLYVLRYSAFVRRPVSLLPHPQGLSASAGASSSVTATPPSRTADAAAAASAAAAAAGGAQEAPKEGARGLPEAEASSEKGTVGSFFLPSPLSMGWRAKEAAVWFYVGESDAIRERLQRHARTWGGGAGSGTGLDDSGAAAAARSGGGACKLDAVVVAMENKSEARRLETAVIRAMKREGFHLVSDNDGSRTHFSSSPSSSSAAGPAS